MSEPVSVPTQSPLVGLDMDPDVAHYVGVLEGTIAAQVIDLAKFRALLELLTGDSWEDAKLDINGEVLKQISIDALVRQTSMNVATAKVLVEKRWAKFNSTDVIVPQAVPIQTTVPENETVVSTETKPEMSERLQAWKAKQIAAASEVENPSVATEELKTKPKTFDTSSISVDARE